MKHIISTLALCVLLLSGCLHEPIHQGNRLEIGKILRINVGDSKFQVEQKLGSPVLNSSLHPNRVVYYEEFEDEESGDLLKRGAEITYDDAWRVKSIRHFGFKSEE